MTHLPRAMLIDMDDTILSAYGRPEIAWHNVAAEFAAEFGPFTSQQVATAVLDSARKFWAVAGAEWRLKLDEARRVTVTGGFAALAAGGHTLSEDLAVRLANRFTAYREEEMFVFPGAHDAIDELKARGVKLALVTNGAAGAQRAKVERFALSHRFDHIQIEGEHGFGKPDRELFGQRVAARRQRRKPVADDDAPGLFQLQPPFGPGGAPELAGGIKHRIGDL